jgi:hypothetical protein
MKTPCYSCSQSRWGGNAVGCDAGNQRLLNARFRSFGMSFAECELWDERIPYSIGQLILDVIDLFVPISEPE